MRSTCLCRGPPTLSVAIRARKLVKDPQRSEFCNQREGTLAGALPSAFRSVLRPCGPPIPECLGFPHRFSLGPTSLFRLRGCHSLSLTGVRFQITPDSVPGTNYSVVFTAAVYFLQPFTLKGTHLNLPMEALFHHQFLPTVTSGFEPDLHYKKTWYCT